MQTAMVEADMTMFGRDHDGTTLCNCTLEKVWGNCNASREESHYLFRELEFFSFFLFLSSRIAALTIRRTPDERNIDGTPYGKNRYMRTTFCVENESLLRIKSECDTCKPSSQRPKQARIKRNPKKQSQPNDDVIPLESNPMKKEKKERKKRGIPKKPKPEPEPKK